MLSLLLVILVSITVGVVTKMFLNSFSYPMSRKLQALRVRDREDIPTHLPCNIPSPDGALFCRLEIGHSGWHSHHGPVSWYFGEWAEDDHPDRYGNIPW